MSKEETKSIAQQIMEYLEGKYDNSDMEVQCEAGWYDWFCKDSSLVGKTNKLYKKLLQIIKSKKFDVNKTYVFFKNNCPVAGSLYDDFRICDFDGNVIFTVTPSSGYDHNKGTAEVYGKENDFKIPLVSGTWKEVVAWFLS